MNKDVDLSIVIVTWNSEKDILHCLSSVQGATKNLVAEVFVVDNASSDSTADIVAKSFPGINLIRNSDNNGFARANNQAIRNARGKYVVLLNPDTKVNSDTFTDSIQYMDDNMAVGILGCAIHNPDGSQQFSIRTFPSLVSQILVLCKLHNFLPNLKPIKKYFAFDFDYEKEQAVEQIMGAFMFIRRSCINQIGLLDEDFWIWFEDVDYCKRATNSGWKVMYTPKISIIHNQSQSFARLRAVQEQKLFNKSMLYYMKKHHSKWAYKILKLFTPVSIGMSAVVEIFEKKRNKLSVK